MKTLLEVLQAGAGYLAGRGIENPRLVMEQLMSHVLKCPRLQLYIRFETVIPDSALAVLREGLKRLAAGEPLQYVVGDTEFMGHCFKTDRRALIPRPDTENLLDVMLECESLWGMERPVIADIGTGSGCVVISLALAKPVACYTAIDVSEEALSLARENAELNGVGKSINFKQGNLLGGFEPSSLDAIVANLPYISTAECSVLPRHIRDYEPRTALDGGDEGLMLIRQLAEQAVNVLRPSGWIFLEIGFDQGAQVVECLTRHGFNGVGVFQDLGHRDRVVRACR